MGVVYRAHDEVLDRDVALKVLPPGTLADERTRQRLRSEAQALARLNHPNIAAVYDFGTESDTDYLVMELVPGDTLDRRVARGALPEKEVATLGALLAAALEDAHESGIVHGDLKPANVAVTSKGQPKVLDFGLATIVVTAPESADAMTVTRARDAAGTLPYMAPEQLRGQPVDARTDLYALGVLLYELATGVRPFQSDTSAALVDEILNASPPSPGRFQPRLSPELERIILKCLEKDCADRYQSAREVAIDLRRLVSPSSGAARTGGSRATRRRRALAWSAGAAVLVLAVAAAALLVRRGDRLDSVVVLPFANATGAHDLDYLGDGIAEELINHLTQVPAVKVIARSTAFAYGDRQATPQQIGADLGVRAIVSGRVAMHGDTVSVQVDIVDTADGSQVWGGKVERPLDRIKFVQQEIAGKVTSALRLRLTSEQERQAARRQTDNPAAYQLYLRGRQDLTEMASPAMFRRSIEMFSRATAADPGFALGWSGLADAYSYLAIMDVDAPGRVLPLARDAARTALRLDPGLAESHGSIGIVKFCYDRDYEGAATEFRQAVAISPGDTFARHWLAHYLEVTGRLSEAHEEMRRIFDLDPLSPIYTTDLALQYYYMGRPEEVVQMSRTWGAPTEGSVFPWLVLAKAQAQLGQRDRSLATLEEVFRRDDSPYMRGWAAWLYGRLGRRDRALATITDLQARTDREYVSSYAPALAYLGLGEREKALQHLEAAERERSVTMLFEAGLHPAFDVIRDEPRFRELLRRLNLPGTRTGTRRHEGPSAAAPALWSRQPSRVLRFPTAARGATPRPRARPRRG